MIRRLAPTAGVATILASAALLLAPSGPAHADELADGPGEPVMTEARDAYPWICPGPRR